MFFSAKGTRFWCVGQQKQAGLWSECVPGFADSVIKGDCPKALGALYELATMWKNLAVPGVLHLELWRAGESLAGSKIGDLTSERVTEENAANRRKVFFPAEVGYFQEGGQGENGQDVVRDR